ncbi:MAG: flagellar hook-associated protein FlgK [Phycisphaeraceae bacterium]|nr:flagellar hook-associated protein FlgK [Phycisphaeraceae bacterium]
MGLTSSLQIGNSALNAAQLAIQVTGNNLANAATPGYSRQVAFLEPNRPDGGGRFQVGTGVRISSIRRQIDEALQARLWSGVSQQAAAQQQSSIMGQIESVLGELGDNDLSSQFSRFFGTWSERANLTQSSAVVIQQGQQLADFIRQMRRELTGQRDQIDRQVGVQVERANGILEKIAQLNGTISTAETSGGQAGSLRDQRDALITELSQYMDVSAVEQENGSVNILVGSTPVVLGSRSRGVELRRQTVGDSIRVSVHVKEDGEGLSIRSGQIGASLADRTATVDRTIGTLDRITSALIFEVNKLHATSTNAQWLTGTSASLGLPAGDRTRALNDPANGVLSSLPFQAVSGGFTVNVKSATGATQAVRINIDLDGIDSTGAPGFGDDTSLESIASQLDAIDGVRASIGADGRLKIDAESGFTFALSDDSSGVLGVLGVNAFFTGTDGTDIGVRADLKTTPSNLMVGRLINGDFVENAGALEIARLQDASLSMLSGQSISRSWLDAAQSLGVQADAAKNRAEAAMMVRDSLEAQRAAVSGVSIDEESVNLLIFQRQYQGAARFIATVDEMTQTLISLL